MIAKYAYDVADMAAGKVVPILDVRTMIVSAMLDAMTRKIDREAADAAGVAGE